jgi:hypothetical protein
MFAPEPIPLHSPQAYHALTNMPFKAFTWIKLASTYSIFVKLTRET